MMIFVVVLKLMVLALLLRDVQAKPRKIYEQYDPIFVTRCEAKCWKLENRGMCVRGCLSKGAKKPGNCPVNTLSPFDAICMEQCILDSECAGLKKCCKHNCGVTCQYPDNLESAMDVPDVPKDLKALEGRRKRTVHLEWVPSESSYLDEGGGTILYLIEERHHAGRHFLESRMTEWSPCSRSSKHNLVLRRLVKPGRWYQFRIAAINQNGTKGYSESSLPFSVSITPKPPKKPENLTVGPLWTKNGSVSTELNWTQPSSDLPIQKYKVFWSKRLHGATKELDSVLVHQQVVSKEKTSFVLQNLQPNSLYFLQVQALAQFGKERLKSEKAALILNTNNYINMTDNALTDNRRGRIEGLHLDELCWFKGELRARIMWKARGEHTKYTVTLWTGPCHHNSTGYNHLKFSATTKVPFFNSHFPVVKKTQKCLDTCFVLYDLQLNCRYRVSVRQASAEGKPTHAYVSFETENHEISRCRSPRQ